MKKRMHETSARNAPKIQLANRKFRWLFVYLFDVQICVHAASRKDAQVRLDLLDITLYTTILDGSALRLHPKQCTFASPLIIYCGIDPFSRKKNHKRRRAVHQGLWWTAHWRSTHGNDRSALPSHARKAATFINESGETSERPASEPTCAELFGGTTSMSRGVTTSRATSGGRRKDWNTSGQRETNLIPHIETYQLQLGKTIVLWSRTINSILR